MSNEITRYEIINRDVTEIELKDAIEKYNLRCDVKEKVEVTEDKDIIRIIDFANINERIKLEDLKSIELELNDLTAKFNDICDELVYQRGK